MSAIGDRFTDGPWEQLGTPSRQFQAVKSWALQMGTWRRVGWR